MRLPLFNWAGWLSLTAGLVLWATGGGPGLLVVALACLFVSVLLGQSVHDWLLGRIDRRGVRQIQEGVEKFMVCVSHLPPGTKGEIYELVSTWRGSTDELLQAIDDILTRKAMEQ